jgi:hypothetical protein
LFSRVFFFFGAAFVFWVIDIKNPFFFPGSFYHHSSTSSVRDRVESVFVRGRESVEWIGERD